jgi:hypothetical protein
VTESQTTAGTETGATSPVGAVGDFLIAAPIQHENLTIFPVLSKTARLEDRFMTLEEGLKAGTVEIRERGANLAAARQGLSAQTAANRAASGQTDEEEGTASADAEVPEEASVGDNVNRLTVVNHGDKPLYLMPGEIIVGGSQDRTIGEEAVIAATGKPVAIDVYCVEHGRWGARDAVTLSLVIRQVAADLPNGDEKVAEANQGKFVTTAGNLSKSSRLAVQAGEGQQKVWEEVEKANDASGATWASGAFTANYVDADVVERIKPYVDVLSRPVSDHERIVGIVVAINGKMETVDVFESTPLFRKLWPQLLKSFVLDALESKDAEEARKPGTPGDAEAFLASVLQDQAGEERKTEGGLVVSRHETKDSISFKGGTGMMGGMGGLASPIHASGFSKK